MEPSARAFAAVRKLAREALQDGWLEPCVDGLPVGKAGDVLTAHRAAWNRPTTGNGCTADGSANCRPARAAIRPDNCETRYHCLYEPTS